MASTLHITGFDRYNEHYENPSERLVAGIFVDELLDRLSDETNGVIGDVRTHILHVTDNKGGESDHAIFRREYLRLKKDMEPDDLVLAFGQGAPFGPDLQVESLFGDRFKRKSDGTPILLGGRPEIVGPGPKVMGAMMDFVVRDEPALQGRYLVSNDAGDYSCNALGRALAVDGVSSVFTHLPMFASEVYKRLGVSRNPESDWAKNPDVIRVMDYELGMQYIVAMAKFLAKGNAVRGRTY